MELFDLIHRVDSHPDFSGLPPQDHFLLVFIIKKHVQKKQISVSDILLLKQFGSRATIHQRLMRLKASDLIDMKRDRWTNKKFISPSSIALALLEEIGQMFYQIERFM